MEADKDLELVTARKIRELRKKLALAKPKERTAREMVVERLVDRGVEVLEAAERLYPKEAAIVIERIAELIKRRALVGYISGGELLHVFRSLGMDVRVETHIAVEKRGRLIPLAEKLKADELRFESS